MFRAHAESVAQTRCKSSVSRARGISLRGRTGDSSTEPRRYSAAPTRQPVVISEAGVERRKPFFLFSFGGLTIEDGNRRILGADVSVCNEARRVDFSSRRVAAHGHPALRALWSGPRGLTGAQARPADRSEVRPTQCLGPQDLEGLRISGSALVVDDRGQCCRVALRRARLRRRLPILRS